jgi:AbrB family looped-hinge helix DNA binding protein
MEPQIARLDRAGRLVLPSAIRHQLELRGGDEVVFSAGDLPGEVRLTPRRAAVQKARALVRQYIPAEPSLVDRLLAERRSDAELETDAADRRPR